MLSYTSVDTFCLDFLVIQKIGLIRWLRLISNFIASQTGKKVIKIHIQPNISLSKESQTMKFGLLIEHSMRNIFLEKSYTKCGGEANSRPFYKNQIWAYPRINSLLCYKVFIVCPSLGLSKYIKTKMLNTSFYLI